MMKTYSEKLQDPRWQRKRLEIMQRDKFQCTYCGSSKSTLHIHHLKYTGEPWEANDDDLETVCGKCHDAIEWFTATIKGNCTGIFFDALILTFRWGLKKGESAGFIKYNNLDSILLLGKIDTIPDITDHLKQIFKH